ncbi:type II CAAX endopeptidase family protein [Actinocorallia longicatena]|uniref:Type II CAAX endopeptidase family protein n=1 Tax=Actinocorallia longicatena TaxID=111803 RepID=A0ABP6Q6M1_9ACTN
MEQLETLPGRRILTKEIWLVFGVSLGASGLSALISFTGSITAPKALNDQTASLVTDAAPGRPWLGLAWQLFYVANALVPVALTAHFLGRGGEPIRRTLGVDWRPRGMDWLRGAAVAAGIGGSGLVLYLLARNFGANLTIVPSTLGDVWWRIPVLVLSAIQNAVVEEVIVLGYLLHRLGQLGWADWKADLTSAAVRGSYHLYQGLGGFFGNMVMGLIFARLYRRWGRVMPLLVAHALIDIVAFVGSVALAGKVSWLPEQ